MGSMLLPRIWSVHGCNLAGYCAPFEFSADWFTALGTLVFLPLQQLISGSGQPIVTGLVAYETHVNRR
jgi:hypothetical protein